jgi:hypothetical protein
MHLVTTMDTRAQGALEYLATYGWAIIVVVVVGVVLHQWGAFDANATMGSQGFSHVKPLDWNCDTDGDANIAFFNGAGGTISNITGAIEGQEAVCTDQNIMSGETFTCEVTGTLTECSGRPDGARYELDASVTYDSPAGLTKESIGTVWGPLESE